VKRHPEQHLHWQSKDGVLSVEISRKIFTLGDVATGGSISIRLLLLKPLAVIPDEQAYLFSPWETTEPIPFDLLAQFQLMGRQTTRILNICNTDGFFKDMGINEFLVNTLIQLIRRTMAQDSWLVVGTTGSNNRALTSFWNHLFGVSPDKHHDYVAQLNHLSLRPGSLFDHYDQYVPISNFLDSDNSGCLRHVKRAKEDLTK
jgi:hypothetical protein